jgi:FlaA1/EpsC-like NDP-sugar epimerase
MERLCSEGVELTVFSRSEKMQLGLRRRYAALRPPGKVRILIGDVMDPAFLRSVFRGQDGVIHAAALKHVDMSEAEPTSYSKVNVLGSINVAEAARQAGVRAVGISTDKACEPVNAYGLTKLLMERVFSEHGHVCVRYGNVFGSDGSVLQLWRRQLGEAGEITVTDKDMTRFFFRIGSAVDEVLWALRRAPASTVIVPPLRAARLMDLARAFVAAAGRGTIRVIGPRRGEKRHESLLSEREAGQSDLIEGRFALRPTIQPQATAHHPITSDAARRIGVEELTDWILNQEEGKPACTV